MPTALDFCEACAELTLVRSAAVEMAHNSSMNGNYPGHDSTPMSHIVQGFRVLTQKLPILRAGPIEQMTDKLKIALPEMIFGDNFISIEYPAKGWSINFNAFDALDRVDKTGQSMLRVAHSQEWQQSRCAYRESGGVAHN